MPRKKAARTVKKKVRKTAVLPKAPLKKVKKTVSGARKPVVQKPVVKKVVTLPQPPHADRQESSLGRPLVTQEEKLYMLFHDDYQSRQVFEFLRVETVRELEQFSPQQIVHLMSRPIRMTVDRIRQRLAEFKRSLKDDEQYAAQFRQGKPRSSDARAGK